MDAYCIDRLSALYCRLKAIAYGRADSQTIHSREGGESLYLGRRERSIDRNPVDYSAVHPLMFNR